VWLWVQAGTATSGSIDEIGGKAMTIGPENFGNGAPKNEDRFAAQLGPYRPGARRDPGRALVGETGSDLVSRNGTSMLETRNGSLDSRSGTHDSRQAALDAAAPIASSIMAPQLSEAAIRDLNELTEPVFSREPWVDQQAGSLVDHPLLRGLLMELPPKGALPSAEYLDRWFEAARSILDLLYTMNARP
jgi:hypothetical protein